MSTRQAFAELLARRAPLDGLTRYPGGISIFRRSERSERAPAHYEPAVILVGQGAKRGFLGRGVYTYDPDHFLVLGVPLPLETQVVEASPAAPLLSLKVPIEAATVRELLLALGPEAPPPGPQGGIHTGVLDEGLRAAALRLLKSLEDPVEARVLAPLCVREILFRVLRSERGHLLRDLVASGSHFRRIARVVSHVHANYAEPLDVAAMAKLARLGSSAFHEAFKATTALTPLQYLKRVRLHRGRGLLLEEGLSVSEAAYRVGYGSPNQFSREFKRLFGRPPREELERLRADAG